MLNILRRIQDTAECTSALALMKDITTQVQKNEVLKSPAAMLKFTATWCGPCRAAAPVVEKLAQRYKHVNCASVDVDKGNDLAKQYGVSSVPTFIFFRNGQITKTIKGADIGAITDAFESFGDAPAMPKIGGHKLSENNKPIIAGVSPASAKKGVSLLLAWIILYFTTLFSFDARKAAR